MPVQRAGDCKSQLATAYRVICNPLDQQNPVDNEFAGHRPVLIVSMR
jgi:hypothetical protein